MKNTSPVKKISFWFIFVMFIIISCYLLFIAFSKPLVDIEVKNVNGQWIVADAYYNHWSESVGLSKGTIIQAVDGVAIENVKNVKQQQIILEAQEIVYQNELGEMNTVSIHITDIPSQFYLIFFIPAFYFILTSAVAIYLYLDKRNIPYIHYLILFQMMCSLAYVSVSTAARNQIVGGVVIGISMLSALILLLQFLRKYFSHLHLTWPFIKRLEVLYILPFSIAILTILELPYPAIASNVSSLILLFFLLLFMAVLFILLYGYFTTHVAQLKLLLYGLVGPFLPFVVLFLLPEIIHLKPILESEFVAIFLLFIPLNFLFIQLTERLFDLQYHISRIRYYGTLAFTAALMITALNWLLLQEQKNSTAAFSLFAITFAITFCLLFVKERIDFRQRKILFTTHGDSIHSVYTSIHRIGRAIHQEQLLELFIQEVKDKLSFTNVQLTISNSTQGLQDELPLKVGEIKRHNQQYTLILHQTPASHVVLKISSSNSIFHLKPEEMVWLELMAIYADIFLGNLTHIEQLLNEIQKIQTFQGETIPWLDKVVWQIVEKEKGVVAQELHDTLLQEQLHLARQLDFYISSPTQATLSLEEIRDQLVDASYTLREYCENLHPPHLDTTDLQNALKKLINKVKIRADFTLQENIEKLTIKDPMLLLMIYRLVQELLNNAIKHSHAHFVSLKLTQIENGFQLYYEDDGIGFPQDLPSHPQSMGIRGMRERVKAFHGHMDIQSLPDQGLKISIHCIEQCAKEASKTERKK